MLLRRFYYTLKPYLPWNVRMGLRRLLARRLRRTTGDIWPINPAAATQPANWPGWPVGKKFAVVLTHDVEGPEGLVRCRELAEREKELGFRSSFNFIPEGTYCVSDELRAWLVAEGFEVGVHDLNHDGRLFTSKPDFTRKAERINHYLRAWGSRGFRAGFMLRNLEWLHQLEIQYDCSTFDTDPFEPQPEAAGTIFPHWIPAPFPDLATNGSTDPSLHQLKIPTSTGAPRPSDLSHRHPSPPSVLPSPTVRPSDRPLPSGLRSPASGLPSPAAEGPEQGAKPRRTGYVELPYTLPQDSTLYLLHQEGTNDIWRDKLEWVASHGGMVLVNVHPDYLHFRGKGPSPQRNVLEHYLDLLKFLQKRFPGAYWHALPHEVATFVHDWRSRTTPGAPRELKS